MWLFYMSDKFSMQLKNQLIEYFKQKYNLDVTLDQADEYLDSLADLVLTFSKSLDKKTRE